MTNHYGSTDKRTSVTSCEIVYYKWGVDWASYQVDGPVGISDVLADVTCPRCIAREAIKPWPVIDLLPAVRIST